MVDMAPNRSAAFHGHLHPQRRGRGIVGPAVPRAGDAFCGNHRVARRADERRSGNAGRAQRSGEGRRFLLLERTGEQDLREYAAHRADAGTRRADGSGPRRTPSLAERVREDFGNRRLHVPCGGLLQQLSGRMPHRPARGRLRVGRRFVLALGLHGRSLLAGRRHHHALVLLPHVRRSAHPRRELSR